MRITWAWIQQKNVIRHKLNGQTLVIWIELTFITCLFRWLYHSFFSTMVRKLLGGYRRHTKWIKLNVKLHWQTPKFICFNIRSILAHWRYYTCRAHNYFRVSSRSKFHLMFFVNYSSFWKWKPLPSNYWENERIFVLNEYQTKLYVAIDDIDSRNK